MKDHGFEKRLRKADRYFGNILRAGWFATALLAVYILFYVWETCVFPVETLGRAEMIPEMIEHLLASCAVLLGVGALAEYLCGQ